MHQQNFLTPAEWRATDLAFTLGVDAQALATILTTLRSAGLRLIDERDELACRWVNVSERPVPPEADTIIRTLTTTIGSQSWSATYWLDGLRAPAMPGPAGSQRQ